MPLQKWIIVSDSTLNEKKKNNSNNISMEESEGHDMDLVPLQLVISRNGK